MGLIPIFCLVAIVTVSQGEDKVFDCTRNAYDQCRQSQEPAKEDIFKNFFPDEQFLQQYCSILTPYFTCVTAYNSQCFADEDREVKHLSPALFSAQIGIELCDENSALRKAYSENVDCLNENLEEIIGCINHTSKIHHDFPRFMGTKGVTDARLVLMNQCFSWMFAMNCFLLENAKYCKENGADALALALKRYQNYMEERVCPSSLMKEISPHFDEYLNESPGRSDILNYFTFGL